MRTVTMELSDEAATKFERWRPRFEQFFSDYILQSDEPSASTDEDALKQWRAHRAWAIRNQGALGYTDAEVDEVVNSL